MKQVYVISSVLLMVLLTCSCKQDYGTYYDYKPASTVYDGNVMKFLQENHFDSMVKVLNKYPDIVARLNSTDSFTLFAIPNKSFEIAINNFNTNRARADSPVLYIDPAHLNMAQADSGRFNNQMMRFLISRYILPGIWSFDTLAQSSTGIILKSINYDYMMNLKGVQQNSTGAISGGPKIIELQDMNFSLYDAYWKPALTSSVNTVRAGNVLVHVLADDHEFGFSNFFDYMNTPYILRNEWKPLSWVSQQPSTVYGGTVSHLFDNNLNTYWNTKNTGTMPPPPFWFIADMAHTYDVTSVAIQNKAEWTSGELMVTAFTTEIAPEGANLNDPAVWSPPDTFRLKLVNGTVGLQAKQRFYLPVARTGRYYRFTVIANYGGFASYKQCNLAEVWLY